MSVNMVCEPNLALLFGNIGVPPLLFRGGPTFATRASASPTVQIWPLFMKLEKLDRKGSHGGDVKRFLPAFHSGSCHPSLAPHYARRLGVSLSGPAASACFSPCDLLGVCLRGIGLPCILLRHCAFSSFPLSARARASPSS